MERRHVVAEDDDSVRPESQAVNDRIIASARIKALSCRSNLAAGAHLCVHLTLALVPTMLGDPLRSHTALLAVLSVWQCFVMSFLFMPLHECSHQSCFETPLLNRVVGHFLGFLTMRPYNHYRFYHFNHHKFTGDPSLDPEMQDSFIDLHLDSWTNYVLYLSSIPFWIDRTTTLIRHGVFRYVVPREQDFLNSRTRAHMLREAHCYVVLYLALALWIYYDMIGASFLLWRMVIPTFFAQPFLRFYLVAEHTGCPVGNNMLSNTRTTRTFWWYRWLAWNMPYHAEHHAFPSVPFHQLPALHAQLRDQEQHRQCDPSGENGYLGVHIGIIRKLLNSKL